MKDLAIEDVEVRDSSVWAHFVVTDNREFIGDFTVEYESDGRGGYVNKDLSGYRAAGGIYANGTKPTVGIMESAADLLTEHKPRVEARQFYTE